MEGVRGIASPSPEARPAVLLGILVVMVFSTNLFEGLKVLHRIPWTWKFASHNVQPVVLATAEYRAPSWLPKVLFSGVLLWQRITVLLFGWAIVASLETVSLNWGLVEHIQAIHGGRKTKI